MSCVSSWDELREILEQLRTADPRPLRGYPDPRSENREPPFGIELAPWASDIARQLHARFGDDVLLTVGFLRYPSARRLDPMGKILPPPSAAGERLLEDSEAEVVAVQPLVVRSGHDLRSELLVTNRGSAPLVIATSGTVFGRVVEPATGEVVGCPAGARHVPLVRFTSSPDETVTIPLVVGTASFRGSLGYAVPPGDWAVEVVLDLGEAGRRRALLPLHVTA